MKSKKLIIISGSPRSGSTWVGKVLAEHPKTHYVHEPFNIGIKRNISPFKYWMEGVFENQPDNHLTNVKKYLKSFYAIDSNFLKSELRKVINFNSFRKFIWTLIELRQVTPILKDPIAFFALEWIYKNFPTKIIITIRHPAAVVASLKQKGWGYDFQQMLDQPDLMNNYLSPLRVEIEEFASTRKTIVEQGALLWKTVYFVNKIYMKNYPSWFYVRNEDLSLDPFDQYEDMLNFTGLSTSQEVYDYVRKTTTARKGEETYLVRDSKRNISKWKNILSEEEIAHIKEFTSGVWEQYYSEKDW